MFESVEVGLIDEVSGNSSIRVQSPLNYIDTVQAMALLIEAKGLKIQAHIDHMSRFQSDDGLARPKSFFLIGEPKGAVRSMESSLIRSLGLSLSFTVFEDEKDIVWVTHKDIELPHTAGDDHQSLINGVANLMHNIMSDLSSLSQTRTLH